MNPTQYFSDQSLVSNVDSLLLGSSLYREFLAEREEIQRHKWFESEKAGQDIGFETALVSWVVHHRARWREARRQRRQTGGCI
jgi:hypothetical protein